MEQQPGTVSTSEERILRAFGFEKADRVPRFYGFWPEFSQKWRDERPGADIDQTTGNDVKIAAADETAWPSGAGEVERTGDTVVSRTGWGVLQRTRHGAMFSETMETRITERVDPDSLEFEDPLMDSRYEGAGRRAEAHRGRFAAFAKTGGPYLRAAFARGQHDFLMDIAEDPEWTKAFVERVADHITTVGVESIRRFGVQSTGIGIYDDVCNIHGPVMGPGAYERIFLPSLRKMVKAYKEAGASYVFHHIDGCVTDLLDMFADAGIDVVHPLERRCNLHPREVLERFGGRLKVMGGLDNCNIVPRGTLDELRAHAEDLLDTGTDGGLVIAPHSIGEDVSVERMEYLTEVLDEGAAETPS